MASLAVKEETKAGFKVGERKRKVVFVIAFEDFRDREYFVPREILEKGDVEVKTISNKKGLAIGADGGEVEVDFLITEINPSDFDAVIFIGGPGCLKFLNNENSYRLISATLDTGKILASICISPVILAKAGVLENKRATVWHSTLDKSPIEALEQNGAEFVDQSVVQDSNIITANGPEVAEEFSNKILENLRL